MIKEGSKIKYSWGNSEVQGKVEETYDHEIMKTIKGNKVTRKGESGNKALYIKTDDGDYVLKSESEVEKI